MVSEPSVKRTVTFFDGQNLYHSVREAFGYFHPNYDILALSKAVCANKGWDLQQVRFYTGVPDLTDDRLWHGFWENKLQAFRDQGVYVFSRPLRYNNQVIKLPDGSKYTFLVGREKGIDVRIALDVIRLAHLREYDVALIFSQDQDLSELFEEIRIIAREQERWIRIACAFPTSPTAINDRGINRTEWIKIDRKLYDANIDNKDYRQESSESKPDPS
jgi:uncharacterized LabA/DUF88 family protein